MIVHGLTRSGWRGGGSGTYNSPVNRTGCILLFCVLLVGLLGSMPGVAEVVESLSPTHSCREDCAGDTSDGKCPSSCNECNCCPRAVHVVFVASNSLGPPQLTEAETAATPCPVLCAAAPRVYHPPRH